jgi:hypothetical protein
MMTVAQQVAHAAQTLDWFIEARPARKASIWISRHMPRLWRA